MAGEVNKMTRCEAQGKIENTYKNIERVYRSLKTHERELDNKRALILEGLERILFIVSDDPQYKEGIEKLDDDGYRTYANMLTNFYNQMMRNNFSNIYLHPNIKSQPYLTVANPPLTPSIPFKNMTPHKQMEFIKEMYIEGEERGGREKGVAAACLRSLRGDMKLEGLFDNDPIFMNGKLRDFLNVNEKGEDYYTWNEVTAPNSDWREVRSAGCAYHQLTAPGTKVTINVSVGISSSYYASVYNRLNAKFCHKDGREAVFAYKNKNEGEFVTHFHDRGTYNYGDDGGNDIELAASTLFNLDHGKYDVAPFEKNLIEIMADTTNPLREEIVKLTRENGGEKSNRDLLSSNSQFWQYDKSIILLY